MITFVGRGSVQSMQEFGQRLSSDRLISLRRQTKSLSLSTSSSAGTAQPLYDVEEMEQGDFVWIFHKMRHEGLPTIGNVRRYRRILRNRLNKNDPEDQQDDGETMPVKIKYLKIGRTIGLETPFSITEETEQNQEGTNALKIVKEFSRVRPMKSLRSLQKRNFGTPNLVLGIAGRGECTLSMDPEFARLARERRELVNIERRKNDCVLNENDIVVLIADNNSDEIVDLFKVARVPNVKELRPKSKIYGKYLTQVEESDTENGTCTFELCDQERYVLFEDLLLSQENDIVSVEPLIHNNVHDKPQYKLHKKIKRDLEKIANDSVLRSSSNDNLDDGNFEDDDDESNVQMTTRRPFRQNRGSRYAQILNNIFN